jgi:hypothetical protein
MAGDIKSLKSYLVSLGFDANMTQYSKFEKTLNDAKKLVAKSTLEMGTDLAKWGAAASGIFIAASGAIVDTIGKIAMADQEYRLFGQRMFLNTQQARSLKIALDALGQPLEAIAFDPELHSRYEQLQKDQKLLAGGLGGDFEGTMKQIRDVMFEFTRLEVEFKYFTFSVAKNIFQALGGGDFVKTLHGLNDWIIKNIPKWSMQFSTYLVPILKDVWHIFVDIGTILIKLEPLIDRVLSLVGWVLDKAMPLFDFVAKNPGLVGGVAAGAKIGSFFGPEGMLAGAAIGGLGGIAYDRLSGDATNAPGAGSGAGSGTTAQQARTLAAQVGAQLGVDPSIIFAQWALETGNFSNRGARSLNNLAGINVPGGNGTDYKSYGSLNEFGNDYIRNIQRNYRGAIGSTNVDQFADALHNGKIGSWFGSSVDAYDKGLRSHASDYSRGGGSTSISVGDINIMQPNASPEQIKQIVIGAVEQHAAINTKRSLVQTRSVYA